MSKVKKFNYANDDDFSKVLERYGKEEYLKEKFPRILEMLYNTREYHQSLVSKKGNIDSGKSENGYEDDFGIDLLPVGCARANSIIQEKGAALSNYGVYSKSHMSMVKKHATIVMSGKIYDPVSGKVFASFSPFENNATKLVDETTIDSRYLDYTKQPIVLTKTNFSAYDNRDGKSICSLDAEEQREISLENMKPTVKTIDVLAPKAKNITDTQILIVYSGRTDDNAAYIFSKAKRMDNLVTVFFPFSIKVTLDENFEFNPKAPTGKIQDAYIRLASSVVLGGAVHFEDYHRENIQIKSNGNVLEFDFPYSADTDANYWGTNMTLGANEAGGSFDFHLNFDINYRIKGTDEYNQNTAIIISSEQLPESQNYVKIKSSKIKWGCLGKDTVIRTENGYAKIDEIQIGDMIYTDKGYIKLKKMITGTEEKIVAVGVNEDKTLLITSEHPIATERGVIRAIDLLSTDKLQTEDGAYKDIYYLDILDYNDKVYSPELEKAALISANGIMVGDYMTPAQEVKTNIRECEPLDPLLVEELTKWHSIKSEQNRKEIIL